MDVYPYKFEPIYKEKIWGGRSLERLFGRPLPAGAKIGESWELADLAEGVSVVANGPDAGKNLTALTAELGERLLGAAAPQPDGRFPLLLKLLDANDMLSLQVHPDREAVARIGGDAALKTECWCVLESRDGYIYKGVNDSVTAERFKEAVQNDTVETLVRRYDVAAGDFHYLPAGTVHALGAGVVVAEVQTPSDTTYRVTDWGRGREIHVERSMECIHFAASAEDAPGADGDTLLVTEFFTVARRTIAPGASRPLPAGTCAAVMMLSGRAEITCLGQGEPTPLTAGDTALIPAALDSPAISAQKNAKNDKSGCSYLEVTL